jgi:hypothetical protein
MGLEHEELADQITDLIDEAERKSVQEYAASLLIERVADLLPKPEERGAGGLKQMAELPPAEPLLAVVLNYSHPPRRGSVHR